MLLIHIMENNTRIHFEDLGTLNYMKWPGKKPIRFPGYLRGNASIKPEMRLLFNKAQGEV